VALLAADIRAHIRAFENVTSNPASSPEPWTEAQLDSVRRLRYEEDA